MIWDFQFSDEIYFNVLKDMDGAIITFFGEQNVWKDFELEYLYIVK